MVEVLRHLCHDIQSLYLGELISKDRYDKMIEGHNNFCQKLLTSDFWEDPTTETLVDLLLDPTTVTLMDLLLDPNKLLASEE